jgi:hypothetical protein
MMKQMFSQSDLDKWFDIFEENAEAAIYEKLQETGEYFVKLARESGSYHDQTGNLRSSIGYVIVKDGTVLDKNFAIAGKGDDPNKGVAVAEKLASTITGMVSGFVLIGVAGMNYAAAVEAKGYEVISASAQQTEIWLSKSIQAIFKAAE